MDFEKPQCQYPPVPCLNSAMVLFLALPDPEHSTPARLVLTSAYLVAAWLWWRSGAQTTTVADSFLWRLGATLLFLLAVNKFFNLRLLFEDGMKAIAKSGNWYDSREPVQFVLAIVLPLLLAAIAMIFIPFAGDIN